MDVDRFVPMSGASPSRNSQPLAALGLVLSEWQYFHAGPEPPGPPRLTARSPTELGHTSPRYPRRPAASFTNPLKNGRPNIPIQSKPPNRASASKLSLPSLPQ